MANLTKSQNEVSDAMRELELSLQAFHNNLALFGDRFRQDTLRDVVLAGGGGVAFGLLATWAIRRLWPAREPQGLR